MKHRYRLLVCHTLAAILICVVASAHTVLFQTDFENGPGDVTFYQQCRDDQYRIIGDPLDHGNHVMQLFQPGKAGCQERDGTTRKRTYMILGTHVQMNELVPLERAYDKLRIVTGEHYWIGLRFNVDPSTPDSESDRAFLFAAAVGEPAILLRGNDTLNVIAERYRSLSGAGRLIEAHQSNHPFTPGVWHTLLIHWKKGLEVAQDGIYEVWLDGAQIVSEHQIITGSDRVGAGHDETTIQTGIYFGEADRPGDYTIMMDDITVVHGADGREYSFFRQDAVRAP